MPSVANTGLRNPWRFGSVVCGGDTWGKIHLESMVYRVIFALKLPFSEVELMTGVWRSIVSL